MSSLSSAFTGIRRSPYQSLTAISIVTITLFVGYCFSLLILGTHQILQYFETRPQVIGFFELKTPADEITQVAKMMESKSYVEGVKIISQQEALEQFKLENQDDPLQLELVTSDILPASIEIGATDVQSLSQIKTELEKIEVVEEVIYQQDIIDSLARWTSSLRSVGIASIGILAFTSFLIISAIIGIKVSSKKQAIRIMRVLGASGWYIKAPFFFEGVLYGLIGSILGWGVMYGSLLYLTPWLREFLGSIVAFPVPLEVFALQLSVGTLAAMFLGGLAGSSAVQRLMK